MKKCAIAFWRESVLIGKDVPSLFGGERWSTKPFGPFLRLHNSGSCSAGHHDTPQSMISIDLMAMIEREAREGKASPELPEKNAAASFLQKSERSRVIQGADRLARPQDFCLAFVDAISKKVPSPKDVLLIRPARYRSTQTGDFLFSIFAERGFEEIDLEAVFFEHSQNNDLNALFVFDRFDIHRIEAHKHDAFSTRLCANGQAAALSSGLADHVAAKMVELANAEEVWRDGYSSFARGLALQAIERVLRSGMSYEKEFVIGGERAPVFPALPRAEHLLSQNVRNELERVREAGESNQKLDALLVSLEEKRSSMLGAMTRLLSLEVNAKFPVLNNPFLWFEKQELLNDALNKDELFYTIAPKALTPADQHFALRGQARTLVPRWFRNRGQDKSELDRGDASLDESLIEHPEAITFDPLTRERLLAKEETFKAHAPTTNESAAANPSPPPSSTISTPPASTTSAASAPTQIKGSKDVGVREPQAKESAASDSPPSTQGPAGIDVTRLSDPRVMQLVVRPELRSLRILVDDQAIDEPHRAIEPLFSDRAAVLRVTRPVLKASSLVVFEYDRKVKS